jgi:hypothetical protein
MRHIPRGGHTFGIAHTVGITEFRSAPLGSKQLGSKQLGSKQLGTKQLGTKQFGGTRPRIVRFRIVRPRSARPAPPLPFDVSTDAMREGGCEGRRTHEARRREGSRRLSPIARTRHRLQPVCPASAGNGGQNAQIPAHVGNLSHGCTATWLRLPRRPTQRMEMISWIARPRLRHTIARHVARNRRLLTCFIGFHAMTARRAAGRCRVHGSRAWSDAHELSKRTGRAVSRNRAAVLCRTTALRRLVPSLALLEAEM